ncbi:MAG: glycerol-3-phosphate responsive antiterminator [Tissierellia bacterium]|nr:glycerol-3-phosphate responsive antiterminator [Tissierellia bacterium]
MHKQEIIEEIERCPVIMAIKDNKDLKECLKSDLKVVFVLFGNINNISYIVEKLKDHNKYVIVHGDLIEGLKSGPLSNEFIKAQTKADGIITTKASTALNAKKLGLFTVLRFFILDSLSFESMKSTLKSTNADLIEILPGIMPKVIKQVGKRTAIPIVAGGLIRDKEDVMDAINANAFAISSSNYDVWKM